MELDDLKQNWLLLNKRLEENEVLNKKIIREMIKKRTTSAYDKLLNMELISLMFIIICIPALLIAANTVRNPPPQIWFIGLEIAFVMAAIWETIKIGWLKKFDLEKKDIYQLSNIIHTYRNWIFKEYMITVPLVMIVLIVRFIHVNGQSYPVFTITWVSVLVILPIYAFVCYRFFYKKYFNHIQKSLDELKDFKEE